MLKLFRVGPVRLFRRTSDVLVSLKLNFTSDEVTFGRVKDGVLPWYLYCLTPTKVISTCGDGSLFLRF